MSRWKFGAAAAFVSASLSACGGGANHATTIVPQAPSGPAPMLVAKTFFYDTGTLRKATYAGPAHFGGFGFNVVLKMRDPAGLIAYSRQASDPASALYRRFLRPQEIGDRFGASTADEQNARTYFTHSGLRVNGWPQRMMLHVSGSQAQLESAFKTTFGTFKLGSDTIVGPVTPPSLPAGVAVAGSTNIVSWANRYKRAFVPGAGGGITTGYSPQQVAAGFDYAGAYAAGYTGSGITVGIIGTGPVAVTGVNNITLGDLDAFKAQFGASGSSKIVLPPITDTVAGASLSNTGFTTPPATTPTTATCNVDTKTPTLNPKSGAPASESPFAGCNPEDLEAQIDTQQAATLARDATVAFYLAYNPNDGCGAPAGTACQPDAGISAQGLLESDAETQQAIADNTADVLSLSFGGPEASFANSPGYFSFEQAQYAAVVAEGIATFVSSGDNGASTCDQAANAACVSYPASDPSVVAVGGVTAPLASSGAIAGPITAWGLQTNVGFGASGGGLSAEFPLPVYQTGVSYRDPSGAAVALTMRGLPDASLLGDPSTGVAIVTNADPTLNGTATSRGPIGGTSVAAPQMAAMWALVLQACKQTASCATAAGGHPYRLGNPDALFYQFYGKGTGPKYLTTFLDVTYGNNQAQCNPMSLPACTNPPSLNPGYDGGAGYDLTTGIGVPFARALIRSVAGV